MYHVGENGWTHVWAGDTTDMYYEYYPVKGKGTVDGEEVKAGN